MELRKAFQNKATDILLKVHISFLRTFKEQNITNNIFAFLLLFFFKQVFALTGSHQFTGIFQHDLKVMILASFSDSFWRTFTFFITIGLAQISLFWFCIQGHFFLCALLTDLVLNKSMANHEMFFLLENASFSPSCVSNLIILIITPCDFH